MLTLGAGAADAKVVFVQHAMRGVGDVGDVESKANPADALPQVVEITSRVVRALAAEGAASVGTARAPHSLPHPKGHKGY